MTWLKKIGLKFQIFLILLGGILATFLFMYLRGNSQIKKQMEYQLSRVKKETELTHLQEDSEEKAKKIADLKKKEEKLREKIKFIEDKEIKGEEVSIEDLENFFAERGF